MIKKRKLFLFTIVLFTVLLITSDNVFADNEWLAYGDKVSCGNIRNIPVIIPNIVSTLVNVLNVAVPVILVIFGVIDLVKAVMSGKEDEIKKGQQSLIKRIITGACIFLIVIAVKFLVSVVDSNMTNKENMVNCINCFISGDCVRSGGGAGSPLPGGTSGVNSRPTLDQKD